MTVAELGERQLLARIRSVLETHSPAPSGVVIGIGDDGAVVATSRNTQTVITTDSQVEGVHFDRRFSTLADIGHRSIAINLSDLAAMGARPRWALLSLMLPPALAVDDIEALVQSAALAAKTHGVSVVGGNLTRSPGPLIVDVTAVGEASPRRVLTRGGGRPGDEVYVSGTIGGAAAGLEMLQEGLGNATPAMAACVARYLRPEPRVRLGLAISQARAARAAMDSSDGLSDALHQLAEASGCGVEIDAEALPVEPGAREWWSGRGTDVVTRAIGASDDYELVVAVPRNWRGRLRHAQARVAEPALTRIGMLTKDPSSRVLRLNGARGTLPGGFEHWRQ